MQHQSVNGFRGAGYLSQLDALLKDLADEKDGSLFGLPVEVDRWDAEHAGGECLRTRTVNVKSAEYAWKCSSSDLP